MIIYNSMILWVTMLGMIYSIIHRNDRKYVNVSWIWGILTFSYIIFWVGIRSGVADTAAYIAGFEDCPKNLGAIAGAFTSKSKAPGFIMLQIIFKTVISDNYHAWLMTIAVLSGIPVMINLKKNSCNFFYSSFLFIVMLHVTWMLNGIRQFIVAAILFGLSDWILKRKTIPFLLMVLLLSTIHYTVLIMIPVYFIVTEKPFSKKINLFCIALLICVVFINPFVSSLENMLSSTAYAGYTLQFADDDGVNPIRVLVMLVPPVLAFIGRRRLRQLNNAYINICINMSIITAGLYFLGMFTSGVLIGRLPIYFELYNLILLPYLIEECFLPDSARITYCFATIGYGIFYYLQMRGSYYISELTGLL